MSGASRSRSGSPGTNGAILERCEIDLVDQRREARHVDRAVAAVEVGFAQPELLEQQELRERFRTAFAATSSRTADPNWRCGSSPCSAWRRFFTSSSSIHRSASRVTRNCE